MGCLFPFYKCNLDICISLFLWVRTISFIIRTPNTIKLKFWCWFHFIVSGLSLYLRVVIYTCILSSVHSIKLRSIIAICSIWINRPILFYYAARTLISANESRYYQIKIFNKSASKGLQNESFKLHVRIKYERACRYQSNCNFLQLIKAGLQLLSRPQVM